MNEWMNEKGKPFLTMESQWKEKKWWKQKIITSQTPCLSFFSQESFMDAKSSGQNHNKKQYIYISLKVPSWQILTEHQGGNHDFTSEKRSSCLLTEPREQLKWVSAPMGRLDVTSLLTGRTGKDTLSPLRYSCQKHITWVNHEKHQINPNQGTLYKAAHRHSSSEMKRD